MVFFNFTPPVILEEFYIRAWHKDHKGHLDKNVYIDILPLFPDKVTFPHKQYFKYKQLEDGYFKVGRFNDRSIAEGPLGDYFGKVYSMRIRIAKNQKVRGVLHDLIFKVQVVPTHLRPCCEPYWSNPFPNGLKGHSNYDQ